MTIDVVTKAGAQIGCFESLQMREFRRSGTAMYLQSFFRHAVPGETVRTASGSD